jgi:hypothetical protein
VTRKCVNPKHVGTPTDAGFSTDWCRLCGGVRLIKPAPAVEVDEDEATAHLNGITW